ncbi:hypothetical protein B7494_g5658 [Chlorociboria aeruginascens]|nr:hypothetical protein B7494_g5658 [Chlorociboria aeruginascens]
MKSSPISSMLLGVGVVVTFVRFASAAQPAYAQCGGEGWTGATDCVAGYTCTYSNTYYSQCLPVPTATTSTSSASATATGQTKYAGVNIAGFDFGCTTDGTCALYSIAPPTNGAAQMSHFVNDDHLNLFRLPVGWQYLVGSTLGGTLDSSNFGNYDQLVQACLATGASCIIDIHNYARWNGAIIGQGGPTNDQFASLWSQLAAKYTNNNRVLFGVMNEPHDLDITTWATSVQAAVTAIRNAGATSNIILLPGTEYTGAGGFVSDGSAAALATVTNLDGSTTNLVFDVHNYLDSDGSGTHTECVTNNTVAIAPLTAWLRSNNRLAINSEVGGGNVASCETYLCDQLQYFNDNSDVFLGYTTWAAGSFDSTYALTETPTQSGSTWTDTALVHACIAR